MGVFDFITDRFKKTPEPEITKTVLPPTIQEPIRSVDIGTSTQPRVGGVTIKGESVFRPRTSRQEIIQKVTGERPQLTQPKEITQLKQTLISQGLTSQQASAVAKREQLKQQAIARGRGFTRTESQRFVGGARGVRALREGRQRGATSRKVREIKIPLTREQQFQRGQSSSTDFLFGGDTTTPQPALRTVEEEGFFPQPVQRGSPVFKASEVGEEGEGVFTLEEAPLRVGFRERVRERFGEAESTGGFIGSILKEGVGTFPVAEAKVRKVAGEISEPVIEKISDIGNIPLVKSIIEFDRPRQQVVVQSPEFKLLTTTIVRGTAFGIPRAIVSKDFKFTGKVPEPVVNIIDRGIKDVGLFKIQSQNIKTISKGFDDLTKSQLAKTFKQDISATKRLGKDIQRQFITQPIKEVRFGLRVARVRAGQKIETLGSRLTQTDIARIGQSVISSRRGGLLGRVPEVPSFLERGRFNLLTGRTRLGARVERFGSVIKESDIIKSLNIKPMSFPVVGKELQLNLRFNLLVGRTRLGVRVERFRTEIIQRIRVPPIVKLSGIRTTRFGALGNIPEGISLFRRVELKLLEKRIGVSEAIKESSLFKIATTRPTKFGALGRVPEVPSFLERGRFNLLVGRTRFGELPSVRNIFNIATTRPTRFGLLGEGSSLVNLKEIERASRSISRIPQLRQPRRGTSFSRTFEEPIRFEQTPLRDITLRRFTTREPRQRDSTIKIFKDVEKDIKSASQGTRQIQVQRRQVQIAKIDLTPSLSDSQFNIRGDLNGLRIRPIFDSNIISITNGQTSITKEFERISKRDIVSSKSILQFRELPRERGRTRQRVRVALVQPQILREITRQPQPQARALRQPQIELFRQPQRFIEFQLTRQVERPIRKRSGFPIPRFKPIRTPKDTIGNFITEVRRGGIFRPIGRSRTLGRAIGLGAGRVSRTLAATFRIRGPITPTRVPGFRTKRERDEFVFIEPRARRLSTGTEVSEIQSFLKRSVKGGGR